MALSVLFLSECILFGEWKGRKNILIKTFHLIFFLLFIHFAAAAAVCLCKNVKWQKNVGGKSSSMSGFLEFTENLSGFYSVKDNFWNGIQVGAWTLQKINLKLHITRDYNYE